MKYNKLTRADRKVIEILLHDNYTLSQIGKRIGFHTSTISREIKKRSSIYGYFADIAQIDAEAKQKISSRNSTKIVHSSTKNYIISRLRLGWSPEQISGRMKLENRDDYICHETIYYFVYNDPYCKKNLLE